jgi:hypothetical protein
MLLLGGLVAACARWLGLWAHISCTPSSPGPASSLSSTAGLLLLICVLLLLLPRNFGDGHHCAAEELHPCWVWQHPLALQVQQHMQQEANMKRLIYQG